MRLRRPPVIRGQLPLLLAVAASFLLILNNEIRSVSLGGARGRANSFIVPARAGHFATLTSLLHQRSPYSTER